MGQIDAESTLGDGYSQVVFIRDEGANYKNLVYFEQIMVNSTPLMQNLSGYLKWYTDRRV